MAVSIVQQTTAEWQTGAATERTMVLTSVTAGNSIYVFAARYATAWSSCSDDIDGSYTYIGQSGPGMYDDAWYLDDVTGGTTTVTVSGASASYHWAIAVEVEGADSAGSLDDWSGVFQGGVAPGTDVIIWDTVTTTVADGLILAFNCNANSFGGNPLEAGTGYTMLKYTGGNAGAIEYKAATSTGDYTPVMTTDASYWGWSNLAVAIKAPSAAGVTIPVIHHHLQNQGIS